jgi:cytochrome c oxidase subunit 2
MRPATRRYARLAALVAAAFVLSSCASSNEEAWQSFGLPVPASDRAPYVGDIWVGTWIAALAVGILVWGLILWASFAYRHRDGDPLPKQMRYHIPIETLYTIVPLMIVAVLFYWTIINGNEVLADDEEPEVRIGVVGQQWSWTFNYLDEDVYNAGTAATVPELVLPVNQRVEFTMNSPDVIHAFWVPSFYFKMDIIPGQTNRFQLTPTREGTYAGRCSELCGAYHSRMLFSVRVVSEDAYQDYLDELRADGQTGIVEAPLRGSYDTEPLTDPGARPTDSA